MGFRSLLYWTSDGKLYLTLSPKKIILGGGVMHQKQLFPMIHKYTQEFLNGYIQKEEVTTDKIKDYIFIQD